MLHTLQKIERVTTRHTLHTLCGAVLTKLEGKPALKKLDTFPVDGCDLIVASFYSITGEFIRKHTRIIHPSDDEFWPGVYVRKEDAQSILKELREYKEKLGL